MNIEATLGDSEKLPTKVNIVTNRKHSPPLPISSSLFPFLHFLLHQLFLLIAVLCMGPSIKYVTLFLANFDPPCHTLSHIPGPPPKVRHTSRTPPIFSRPSTKIPDKSPPYKFYLNCSRRFLSGFCPDWFCPFPLLSQYICYNRKLNITLNFMFHMYDKNLYKHDVTCS